MVASAECFVGENGINKGQRAQDDGTTPNGIFKAGRSFGILPAPEGTKVDYYVLDEDDYWDGDRESSMYNTMVKGSAMPADWDRESSEHLIDYTGAYDYCIDIGYNRDPVVPGAGFAIFLHCTRDNMERTQGCVAIPKEDMVKCLSLVNDSTYFVILSEGMNLYSAEQED